MRLQEHVSDHDLVLALDRELPARRQAVVDDHLIACSSCRLRRTALHGGAVLDRSLESDADAIQVARARLRTTFAEMNCRRDRSLVARLSLPLMAASRWALVGVAALAAVLLVHVVREPASRLAAESVAPIEADARPVSSLTPGATWNLTTAELCAPGGREQRQVSDAIRLEVLRGYGMQRVPATEYELDYLITPELGGAPAVENLWPQRYASRLWNAHVKDQLEVLLPKLVCDGTLPLHLAQRELADDWIAAYKKHFQTSVPLQLQASAATARGWDPSENDIVEYPVWRSGSAPALQLVSLSRSR